MTTDTNISINIKAGPALMIGGGLLVALGSLLPWVSLHHVFGSMSVLGIDGDGKFTLALAVALVMGGWAQMRSATFLRWPAVVAVIGAAFVAIEFMMVSYNISDGSNEFARASIGVGLYLVAIGAAIAVFGALKSRNS